MTKRNWLCASALVACGVAAHAQTSAEVYGILDTGVEILTNVAGKGHLARMPTVTGGQVASRLGFRGTEDLGGGQRAIFNLEAGFGSDNGKPLQSGRIFGRQAFVGLAGEWGAFTMGRQYTATVYALGDADVIGPAAFGAGIMDPYLPQARTDNSLAYKGTFSGLTVAATYSLGRDVAPTGDCPESVGRSCTAWSALAKYDGAGWGVALAHEQLNGGPTGVFIGQPVNAISSSDSTDVRSTLTGYYKMAGAKLGLGWIKHKMDVHPDRLDRDLYFVGAGYPVTNAFSVDAQLFMLRDARSDSDANAVVVRGNYLLSRRTALYLMVGHLRNQAAAAYSISGGELVTAAPAAGGRQSGLMIGIRHNF